MMRNRSWLAGLASKIFPRRFAAAKRALRCRTNSLRSFSDAPLASERLEPRHLLTVSVGDLGFDEPLEPIAAQIDTSGMWQSIFDPALVSGRGSSDSVSYLSLSDYASFTLDQSVLDLRIDAAPAEAARGAGAVITLPTPEGQFQQFAFWDSPIMAPELAEQFPEIQTFVAQGIDDPAAMARLDWTPQGFHAQVLSPDGAYYVDPFYHLQPDGPYVSYFSSDYLADAESSFACETIDASAAASSTGDSVNATASETALTSSGETTHGDDFSPLYQHGNQLRTYDLLVAATGEYSEFHGGTVNAATAAIATTINRVTGIFERDIGVRINFAYSHIELDPYTDSYDLNPYDSTNAEQCQNVIDYNYGYGNPAFDFAHTFHQGFLEGNAYAIGTIANNATRAGAWSSALYPINDSFNVSIVAHEMGHQFGANHTFNGQAFARWEATAVEPGSGSTIMSYAGLVPGENLQSQADPYFNIVSIDEMITFSTLGAANAAASITNTGNNLPSVSAGSNYVIPAATPFYLTATGSDPDGDTLTYCWEQINSAIFSQSVHAGDDGFSPLFRSWSPTTDATRYFPRWGDVIDGSPVVGETLPTTNRYLDFAVTVRDNRAGGGGIDFDTMYVTVVNTGSPFAVTSPNSAVSWPANSTQTVSWNVAGTNAGSINASSVLIGLIADGVSYTLAAETANDGSHQITVPDILASAARIYIQPVGNIFYDISDTNFSILPEGVYIVDNADVGFSVADPSNWYLSSQVGYGVNNSYFAATASNIIDAPLSRWSQDLPNGQYRVAASWMGAAANATDAYYDFYDGGDPTNPLNYGTYLSWSSADHSQDPAEDFIESAVPFQSLAEGLLVESGTLRTELSAWDPYFPGWTYVIADAIRYEKINDGYLEIALASSTISEAAGATTATITRRGNLEGDLAISLVNYDPSEVSLQTTVTILDGQSLVTVPINAVDDDEEDGTQSVTIRATATDYSTGETTLLVTDEGDSNQAPSGVGLVISTSSLPENTDTTSAIKLADIQVNDDALGTNAISLTGADAASFTLVGTELFLAAGTLLDYETKSSFDVTVSVEDSSVSGSTPVTANMTLSVTDTPATVAVAVTEQGDESDNSSSIFTLTRAGDTSGTLAVNLLLLGSAKAGVDYTAPAGLGVDNTLAVSFADGEATTTIDLQTLSDAVIDPLESIHAILQPGTGYSIAPAQDRGTVYLGAEGVAVELSMLDSAHSSSGVKADDGFTPGASQATNIGAFTALNTDGTVSAWGEMDWGAISNAAPAGSGFTQVVPNAYAFAGLKDDGTIECWGRSGRGGGGGGEVAAPVDSGYVALYSNEAAFAAMKSDGSLTIWGHAGHAAGQTPSNNQGFVRVVANAEDFTAIRADGTLWSSLSGAPQDGGYTQVTANKDAFTAMKADGSLTLWGEVSRGDGLPGDTGYERIYSNPYASAALKTDGTLASWGYDGYGGSGAAPAGTGYTTIVPGHYAFAALNGDGTVTSWGSNVYGGSGAPVDSGYVQLIGSERAFAALNEDGTVQSWGDGSYGGSGAPVDGGYVHLFSAGSAFVAMKADGSLSAWGNASKGGSGAPGDTGYVQVYGNTYAFVAVSPDGSMTAWGDGTYGGSGAPAGTGFVDFAAPKPQFLLSATNQAPTGVALSNAVTSLPEDTDTSSAVKVADIQVTDDGHAESANTISLSGTDAASFAVVGTELYLAAGTALDYETKDSYDVTVSVEDSSVAGSTPVTVNYSLAITDVNEAPTGVALTNVVISLPEDTDTSSRVKIADIDVTDDALGSNAISLSGADLISFEVDGTELFLAAGTALDYETQASYTFTVNVEDSSVAGSTPVTVNYTLLITDANDAPVLDDANMSVAENSAEGTVVGTLAATDQDGTDPIETSLVFWVDDGNVYRSERDGSNLTQIHDGSNEYFEWVETDPANDHLYLRGEDGVWRMDYDGSNLTNLVGGLQDGFGIAVDIPNNTIYYGDFGNPGVYRSDLDGSNIQLLPNTSSGSDMLRHVHDIEVVSSIDKVYYTNAEHAQFNRFRGIRRANLDGTGVEDVVDFSNNDPVAVLLAVDETNGHLYYSHEPQGTITKSDLDGSNASTFLSGLTEIYDLEVDAAEGKLYYSSSSLVGRINLDGTGQETLTTLGGNRFSKGLALSYTLVPAITYSITSNVNPDGDGNDAFRIEGDKIVVNDADDLDFESDTQLIITAQASDGSLTDTATVTVAITDENEAPTGVALTNTVTSLPEDTDTTSAVKLADIQVTDDALGTNVISLSGADAASFTVVGTELFLVAGTALDYETQASYDVTVSVEDSSVSGSTPVTVNYSLAISDVNEAPTGVALTNTVTSLPEDTDTTSAIKLADIQVTDDALGTNVISLSGADANDFDVVGTELYLVAGTALDYESKTSYAVMLSVEDSSVAGSTPVTVNMTLSVSDVNEAPSGVGLVISTSSLPENTDTSSAIKLADIQVTDDALGTNVISLSGADAVSFSVVGTELYLAAGTSLDYETQSSYDVTVSVEDSSVSGSTPVTVNMTLSVSDVNEAPTGVALANTVTSLPEDTDTTSAIKVADIQITDDALGTNVISLSGADANDFEVVGTELQLKAGTALDYETQSSYSVTVSVEDSGVSGSTPVTVNHTLAISDVNEAPSGVGLVISTSSLPEDTDTSSAVKVADIQVTDDALGTNVISLSGTDAASFTVVGTELFLAAGTALDYETQASYDVTVSVEDSSVSGSTPVTVNYSLAISDVNEAPTGVALANTVTSLPEDTDTSSAVKVADIQVTDDALGTNVISLSGADANDFDVVGTELYLVAGTALDYETQASYDVTVSVEDSSVSGSTPVTVNYSLAISDVNEAPTGVALTNVVISLPEDTDTSSRVKIADIDVTDDGLGSNAISLSGADPINFEVDGTELFLAAGTALDYETQASYEVTVSVEDSSVSGSTPVTVNYSLAISDVNEAPTGVALANTVTSLPEDTDTTSAVKVADIQVTDDALGTNVISLSGTDAASFTVVGTELFLVAGTALDYETKTSYAVTVNVEDTNVGGSTPVTVNYTLAITDVNEGLLSGVLFEDTNGNGTQDNGEGGLAGWTVYLDANSNGVLDNSETSTVTTADDPATAEVDETGAYSFSPVDNGDYSVDVLVSGDWVRTSPSGMRFADPVSINSVGNGTAIVAGDFNGDGTADLAGISSELFVSFSNGDGSFTSPANYVTGARPEFMAVGDLDGDDDIDIVVSNHSFAVSGTPGVTVYLNDGQGGFANQTFYAEGAFTQAVALADVENDGDLDIVFVDRNGDPAWDAHPNGDEIEVMLNDGSGSFGAATEYWIDVEQPGASVYVGDIDNDGDVDVLVGGGLGISLTTVKNDGAGGFAPFEQYSGINPAGLGDLDGDGDLDLLHSAGWYSNDGNGSFTQADTLASMSRSALVDLDGDEDLDIVGFVSGEYVALVNDGSGTFAAATVVTDAIGEARIIAGDFNEDGRADLATNSHVITNLFGSYGVSLPGDGNQTELHFGFQAMPVNEAPTGVALANTVTSLPEDTDTASAVKVADIQVTDDGHADSSNAISLSGADANDFDVVGTELFLAAGTALDYETQASYDVTVSVEDSSVSGSTPVTVNYSLAISDVNEAPTGVALTNVVISLPEDTDTTSAVKLADIQVTDDALGNNAIILSGTDAVFTVVGTELFLAAGTALDYETQSSYDVTVSVEDSSVSGSTPVTVNYSLAISDVNEAPTGVALTNVVISLPEDTDTTSPVKIADIDVTDDALGTNAISLTGTDAASFTVVGTELFLAAGTALDYETQSSYDVTVSVEDGSVSGSTPVTVNYSLAISDVNEAPTGVALANTVTSLPEDTDTSSAVKVADIQVTDDALGTNAISLSGTDAASFTVVGTELFLVAGTALDYETQASYEVTVSVEDSSVSGSTPVTVNYSLAISDVNEAPTGVALANTVTSLPEDTDTSSAVKVADIQVTDDALGTNVISLSGADANDFDVVGTELYLVAGTALDYETQASYDVTVSVEDSSVSGSTPVTVNMTLSVSDVNEAPSGVGLVISTSSLPENTDTSSAIKLADIQVTDDALGTNVISLSGTDAASFTVVGTELFLVAGTALDYETQASYDVTVSVEDSSVSGSTPVTVNMTLSVSDVNEAPSGVGLVISTSSLPENTDTSSAIKLADIQVTDDALGTNVISLSGADANDFDVVGTELYLVAGTALDYESKTSYAVMLSVEDSSVAGSTPVTVNMTLSVSDVNEAPSGVGLVISTSSLPENTDTSSAIKLADIQVTDDALGTNVISLSGADANDFDVVGTELYLVAGTALDYETQSSYDVTVSVEDGSVSGSTPVTVNYSLAISDVNEAPTGVALANTVTSLPEDTDTSSAVKVADIQVTDDALGTNAISLSGTDAASFTVVGTELFLAAGTALDYETQASYDVTVSVEDSSVSGSTPVTVNYSLAISDVNEAPTGVALANTVTSLPEDTDTSSAVKVADIQVTDDALGTNVISLSGADAASFTVVGTELFLVAGTALDYETQASYEVTVSVEDSSVSGSTPVTVNYSLAISDVNDSVLSGTVFEDINSDGTRDAEDIGLAGWTVYLDTNNDGVLDGGEVTTTTLADDPATAETNEAGSYSFTGLTTSQYTVRIVVQSDWVVTSPAIAEFTSGDSVGVNALISADFNDDGVNDLAGTAGVVLSDGQGGFGDATALGISLIYLAAGDIDNDGDIDLAAANMNDLAVLLNDGQGTFASPVFYSVFGHGGKLAIADVNDDGNLDIAVVDYGPAELVVMLGDGTGAFGTPSDYASGGSEPDYLVMGDYDLDGDIDAVVQNHNGGGSSDIAFLANDGNGVFSHVSSYSVDATYVQYLEQADIDGDGDLDILASATTSNTIRIFENDGSGGFGTTTTYGDLRYAKFGDMDNDGDQDILAQSSAGLGFMLFTNDGYGNFSSPVSVVAANNSARFVIDDLDGDGRVDLTVEGSVYLNQIDQTPSQTATASASGLDFGVMQPVVNEAPTDVALSNTVSSLPEDTDTSSRVKIADIDVTDDGLGTNAISLSGADLISFEVDGTELFLVAGTALDYETQASYDVTVSVEDSSVSGSTPVTVNYSLAISDVNEAPTGVALTNVVISLPEDTDTTSAVKLADIQVTDDALGNNAIILSGTDAVFTVVGTELFLAAGTALDYETQSSYDVTVSVEDGSVAGSTPVTVNYTLLITNVNDAPEFSYPGPQSVAEDTDLVFSAAGGNPLGLSDEDAGDAEVGMRIDANYGLLTLPDTTGLTFLFGSINGSHSLSVLGTIADINTALDGLIYSPLADYHGADTLSLTAHDLGHSGPGGNQMSVATVEIAINPVNDAPQLTIPADQTTPFNTTLFFSAANDNAIQAEDVDAGTAEIGMLLSLTSGTFSLAQTTGLTIFSGSDNSSLIMCTGTLANINAALEGLGYTPSLDVAGDATLTILLNDLGNSGSGNDLSDTKTVVITAETGTYVPVTIIDSSEGAPGFVPSSSSGWITQSSKPLAYLENTHKLKIINQVSGTQAEWVFSDLPNGQYKVATTWWSTPSRATAPYTIGWGDFGNSSGGVLATKECDQTQAPDDFTDGDGWTWEELGTVNVEHGELKVRLEDGIGPWYKNLIADAVRIEKLGSVTPTLTVAIVADSVSEAAGAAATTATVTRTDTSGDLVVTLASDDTSEATVPSSVTILDGQSSASFEIAAIDDSAADGTQTVTFSATATGYTAGSDTLEVTDDEVSAVTIIDSSEGAPGFIPSSSSGWTTQSSKPLAYLENTHKLKIINQVSGTQAEWVFSDLPNGQYKVATTWWYTPSRATAPYTIGWGDFGNSSGGVLATKECDQTQAPDDFTDGDGWTWEELGTVNVEHGELKVRLEDGIGPWYKNLIADAVRIEKLGSITPTLTVAIAADSVSEAAGTAATTATVTRTDTSGDLVVSLASDDTSEATVPLSVTILDGQSSASFEIAAIDDSAADGTQTVTFSATATGYTAGSDTLEVTDDEVSAVTIIDSSEGAPGFVPSSSSGWITQSSKPLAYLENTHKLKIINQVSGTQAEWVFSDLPNGQYKVATTWWYTPSRATAPYTIGWGDFGNSSGGVLATKECDQTQAPDDFTDGDGWTWEELGTVNVEHGELKVRLEDGIGHESKNLIADAVRIEKLGSVIPALTVAIAADSVSEAAGTAATTATVTILDGQSSASFEIAAVDDAAADGTQTVTFSATATGYTTGSDTLEVTDDEAALVTIIDNGESGFTQTGFSYQNNSQVAAAYDGDNHTMWNGTGEATWSFSGLENGEYQVTATWAHKYGNRYNAPAAPFAIQDGSGAVLASITVDQRNSPSQFAYEGYHWDTLGTVNVADGTLVVTLGADAQSNTYSVADAVRIERLLPSARAAEASATQRVPFTTELGGSFGGSTTLSESDEEFVGTQILASGPANLTPTRAAYDTGTRELADRAAQAADAALIEDPLDEVFDELATDWQQTLAGDDADPFAGL